MEGSGPLQPTFNKKFITELVLEGLKKSPERILQIHDDDGVSMRIISFAQNLLSLGIKSEDVVAVVCVVSSNLSFDYVYSWNHSGRRGR